MTNHVDQIISDNQRLLHVTSLQSSIIITINKIITILLYLFHREIFDVIMRIDYYSYLKCLFLFLLIDQVI